MSASMKFEDLIEQLILTNDCVIIPEFGGFISNYESAFIDANKNIIHPPTKQVLFNPRLVKNDGILLTSWMNIKGETYQDSLVQINRAIQIWRKQLELGSRIEIGEIGFLFVQNKVVVFEQNREINLLLSAYGLKAVKYNQSQPSIKQEFEDTSNVVTLFNQAITHDKIEYSDASQEEKKDTIVIKLEDRKKVIKETVKPKKVQETDNSKVKKNPKNYKKVVKWVAAAAIVPVAFYSYWIPMKTDFLNTGKIHYSDLNPFSSASNKMYQKRNSSFDFVLPEANKTLEELTAGIPHDVEVYNLSITEDLIIPVKRDITEVKNVFYKEAKFQVVAGCFSVESNANNLVAKLNNEGFVADIFDKHKGLYRVSAGALNSESEADILKEQLENKGYSAWILKN